MVCRSVIACEAGAQVGADGEREGIDEAIRLHRDRYHPAELIYIAEVDPRRLADIIIDNRDLKNPRVVRRGSIPRGQLLEALDAVLAAAERSGVSA